MGRVIDITGQKFGRLIAIKRVYPNSKNRTTRWLCKCECGGKKIVDKGCLISGGTKSCGCLAFEHIRKIGKRKLGYGVAKMRSLISKYKRSARKRGLEWNLTEEQFKEITQQNCHYCGAKPNNISKNYTTFNGDYVYNGIDRVDNTKGYMINNVVPCCKICNRAKNDLPLKEFKEWVKRIYNFRIKDYV